MTKKIALLFSGMPRLYDDPADKWREIIDNLSADVFIHNWRVDNTDQQNAILDFFKPTAYQIDEPDQFNVEWVRACSPRNLNIHNIFSSLTSKKRVFDLMENYYKQNNQPYPDLIIVSRPDLLLFKFDPIDMPTLVIPMEPFKVPDSFHFLQQWLPSQQDMICYGPFDSVKVYCGLIDAIGTIYEKCPIWFVSEWLLVAHLWMNRVVIYNHVLYMKLIRD
jgi:hypothetical protein